MGAGHQICGGVAFAQYALKNGPMVVGGVDQPDARLVEPALNARGGFLDGERPLVQPGFGG
jgi:hypothetical protein